MKWKDIDGGMGRAAKLTEQMEIGEEGVEIVHPATGPNDSDRACVCQLDWSVERDQKRAVAIPVDWLDRRQAQENAVGERDRFVDDMTMAAHRDPITRGELHDR